MKVSITSIELKGPLKFFMLSGKARHIMKQLKSTNYKGFKKKGFWTTHYTMTLWENEEQLQEFTRSGAHLNAMKTSKEIAKEIRTITVDSDSLLDWKNGIILLEKAKIIKY